MAQTKTVSKTDKAKTTRKRSKRAPQRKAPSRAKSVSSPRKKTSKAKAVVKIASEKKELLQQSLPSGRSLSIHVVDGIEEIEIRNENGPIEISIRLTAEGPVISLSGGQIGLAAKNIRLEAEQLSLNSTGDLDIRAGGELRLNSQTDLRLNGNVIHIN
jgi:hypothetical protein